MSGQLVAITTVLVIAGAVGGYFYGIFTGRIIDGVAYTIVVASAGASVALFTGWGPATFVSVISIIAAGIGQSATYRIIPAIPTGLIAGAATLALLWDVAFFGSRLIFG